MIHISMVLHNFATKENALAGRHHADYDATKDDSTWSAFYTANKCMLCPSCKRRSAKHCVHVHQYVRLTRDRQRTRYYKDKAPCAVRDDLRDELWEALNNPAVLHAGDLEHLDMLAQIGNDHAAKMRERALTGKYT